MHQVQALVEVGAVNHRQDSGRLCRTWHASQSNIHCDPFFGGMCAQGESTGQIDQLEHRIVETRNANMFLDRDAGVIADLLAHPGETIEQRAFAGIGIPKYRDAGCGVPADAYLINRNAARFRTSHLLPAQR